MYKGTGIARAEYTVQAEDTNEAIDYIMDMVKEDFPDAEVYEVIDVRELK